MSPLEELTAAAFADGGPVSAGFSSYRPRGGQIQLARAVARRIEEGGCLVAEAGTGIGKTFAYLAPLLLADQRALVSTASKALQDQLFVRDLPRLAALLQRPVRIALLKGRSNYLCPYRIEKAALEASFARRQDAEDFQRIQVFLPQSGDGDIARVPGVSESSGVWPVVTSTADNCLGSACPKLSSCPVVAARERASEADVVVVNHHLLCADWAMRLDGGGELLPEVDVVVVDEAHGLKEIAYQFLSHSLSTHGLLSFGKELEAAGRSLARDHCDWVLHCSQLETAAKSLRLAIAAPHGPHGGRTAWADLSPDVERALRDAMAMTESALMRLLDVMADARSRHPELEKLAQRLSELLSGFERVVPGAVSDGVFWLESSRTGAGLHWAPLELAPMVQGTFARPRPRAWVFLSATLTPQPAQFGHFCDGLGIVPDETLSLESPFDYAQQALLCVPEGLPDPKDRDLMRNLLEREEIWQALMAVPGGIFILCTSLRAVSQAAECLREGGRRANHGRRLLVQGEHPKDTLLEMFRNDGRALLVGSASFWEGVDVPGSALQLVLIDKLPFAPPDDPVLDARMRACRGGGGDPFKDIQVPEASLTLKQGAGRLIRSEDDRGVLMVGDRRLAETHYGRQMVRALPAFARTRDLKDVQKFVAQLGEKARTLEL